MNFIGAVILNLFATVRTVNYVVNATADGTACALCGEVAVYGIDRPAEVLRGIPAHARTGAWNLCQACAEEYHGEAEENGMTWELAG